MCIDTTEETNSIGRFLNHSNIPNLKPEKTELLWAYGETRKEVLKANPLVADKKKQKGIFSFKISLLLLFEKLMLYTAYEIDTLRFHFSKKYKGKFFATCLF